MIANGVILAENDTLTRGLLRSVLLRADLQVFPVADGMEALAVARQFIARLVLLDVAMPRLNGLLACEAIHVLPGYARVPIIMLTGYDDERIKAAARRFGAIEFITKPFRPDQLLARIAAHIDIKTERRGAVAAPEDGSRGQVWEKPAEPDWLRRAAPAQARVQVWSAPADPVQAFDEPAPAADGREMVRILRGAERGT